MTRRHRPDDGFVTVAVAGLAVVLVAVAVLVATLGAVAVARHQAMAAADLAALAAAKHALEGPGPACRAAASVAAAQGAELAACRLEGLDARVEALVRPAGPLGAWGAARAQARAGPSDPLWRQSTAP